MKIIKKYWWGIVFIVLSVYYLSLSTESKDILYNEFNKNILLLSTLVSIIILLITTYYLWRTAKINEKLLNVELRNQIERENERLPKVICYFELNEDVIRNGFQDLISFVTENVGGSSAYNVKVKMDKDFISSMHDGIDDQFKKFDLFNNGISDIPAKGKYKLDSGSYHYLHKSNQKEFIADIEYEDENSRKFNKQFRISYIHLMNTHRILKPDSVRVSLKNITEELKKITNVLEEKNTPNID